MSTVSHDDTRLSTLSKIVLGAIVAAGVAAAALVAFGFIPQRVAAGWVLSAVMPVPAGVSPLLIRGLRGRAIGGLIAAACSVPAMLVGYATFPSWFDPPVWIVFGAPFISLFVWMIAEAFWSPPQAISGKRALQMAGLILIAGTCLPLLIFQQGLPWLPSARPAWILAAFGMLVGLIGAIPYVFVACRRPVARNAPRTDGDADE